MKDEDFFKRVEPIRDKLYRIAYSYFTSQSMAIDMTDEAIYKGYLKKHQLKQDEYFETWLIRILLNVCNKHYKKYRKEIGIEEMPEETTVESYDSIPLKLAIKQLPEKYRQPVILKYFGGYTITNIAELLNLPQGTIATRLRKALQLLRMDLEE